MEENQKNTNNKSFSFVTLLIVSIVSLLIGACIMFTLSITGIFSPTKPIAKVKGKTYTQIDVQNLLSSYLGENSNIKLSLILDSIDYEILNKKIQLTDSDKTEIESYISLYSQYYGLSEEYAKQYLTVAKLRDAYYLDYIANQYITNDDIQAYYDNSVVGDIDCEHIVITPDENLSDSKALALAKEIIKKLNAGTSFADVAEEYENNNSDHVKHESFICSSTESSGTEKVLFSDLDKAFTDGLLALEDNSYSKDPVKSSFGYHIILRKTQSEKPALDDSLKSKISAVLADKYIQDNSDSIDSSTYLTLLIDLRNDNNFKIYDKDLQKAYDEYCESAKISKNN